jgi:hypothetical protein
MDKDDDGVNFFRGALFAGALGSMIWFAVAILII